ncbi:hypothetical protein RHMOL_Rhmol09G0017400 [Rhododendron molle]|uniref:Uncharacterized protein n=1 Tax=Rhododendron molle TaxID=49168 RepID=A0ACC0M9U6_RHOML|nr:hypothetical protein RHMOL_Rhmol09G0017400 [Rhododendron molle]
MPKGLPPKLPPRLPSLPSAQASAKATKLDHYLIPPSHLAHKFLLGPNANVAQICKDNAASSLKRIIIDPHLQHCPIKIKFLTMLELFGFSGHPAELELAVYLLENAASSLKRIIIDPHLQHCPVDFMFPKKVEAARESAKQLETKLPPPAKLVIV